MWKWEYSRVSWYPKRHPQTTQVEARSQRMEKYSARQHFFRCRGA